ncbi:hypothetical protein Tco_1313877 [Tanacetum coccineum]
MTRKWLLYKSLDALMGHGLSVVMMSMIKNMRCEHGVMNRCISCQQQLPSGFLHVYVEFRTISLTEFRSCASHSQTGASQSRQSTNSLQKSVVSFSYSSTNKAFQVTKDPPCLKPFLNGKHELLASFNIFPCPKPCVQTRIHPDDLEFLDPVFQCLINLLQSAVAELVDLIEAHDHLNPIFIPKCDGS